uniref:Integrase catalytic domain-containing protein n=1 Tax=Peronospora matthiolae TaxID=2874970 RepID=A0AAV1TKH7_9STRA
MHGICYKPSVKIDFRGYSDADWSGDLTDHKSTSGYVFILLGAPRSTLRLSLATQEGKWIHCLLCKIMAAANEYGPELMIREDK